MNVQAIAALEPALRELDRTDKVDVGFVRQQVTRTLDALRGRASGRTAWLPISMAPQQRNVLVRFALPGNGEAVVAIARTIDTVEGGTMWRTSCGRVLHDYKAPTHWQWLPSAEIEPPAPKPGELMEGGQMLHQSAAEREVTALRAKLARVREAAMPDGDRTSFERVRDVLAIIDERSEG